MKKKFILLASGIACFISIQSVYAASMSKTLRGTCAGTSASVTATYYTHETTHDGKQDHQPISAILEKVDTLLNQEVQALIK